MGEKGSFIGFTFGNRHSSELGIFRTSSNKIDLSVAPPTADTVTWNGTTDGQYYWGSKYITREMPISFAFYGLTELQLAQLKQILNDKKIHPLILDEEPYKVWSAKLTGMSTFKHLCFENGEDRFYCGEGSLVFTAYYPFAKSRYQYLEDYTKENIREWIGYPDLSGESGAIIFPAILSYDFTEEEIANGTGFLITPAEWAKDQNFSSVDISLEDINSYVDFFYGYNVYGNLEAWREASKIPSLSEYGSYLDGRYRLYNAGDISMPFKIYFSVNDTAQNFTLQCADNCLKLQNVKAQGEDKYILIDGFTHTIYGCDLNYKKTKNLYNEKITEGDFFKLPVGELELISSSEGALLFNYLYL